MTSNIHCRRIKCQEAWDSPQWSKIRAEYAKDVQYPDLPADPDWDQYRLLEASGVLRCVGIFDGEKLIGFANYTLYSLPHFAGKRLASSESLWLDLDYRHQGVGHQLIQALFDFAKEDGAFGIYLGAKIGTRAAEVFEKIATPMNVLFWRKL